MYKPDVTSDLALISEKIKSCMISNCVPNLIIHVDTQIVLRRSDKIKSNVYLRLKRRAQFKQSSYHDSDKFSCFEAQKLNKEVSIIHYTDLIITKGLKYLQILKRISSNCRKIALEFQSLTSYNKYEHSKILKSISIFPNVTHFKIHLENFTFGKIVISYLAKALNNMLNLRYFEIFLRLGTPTIINDELDCLIEKISSLKSLEFLKLGFQTPSKQEFMERFDSKLQNLKSIKFYYLSFPNLQTPILSFNYLSDFKSLQKLELVFPGSYTLIETSFRSLGSALENFNSLYYFSLDIFDNRDLNENIVKILVSPLSNHRLSTLKLDFSLTSMTDSCLDIISEVIIKCHALEVFDFKMNSCSKVELASIRNFCYRSLPILEKCKELSLKARSSKPNAKSLECQLQELFKKIPKFSIELVYQTTFIPNNRSSVK